jgi:hypothetical protein
MPTQAPARPKGNAQAAAPAPRPFRIGAIFHEEINYDKTATLTDSTQDMEVLEIPPSGYLRGMYLLVEGTSATNAATTTAVNNNAPFSVIDSVTFEDTNSKPIVGPFNGFDLYLINKYGGYDFSSDPKASTIYNMDTGAGATITFNFILRIPVELVARDALGALPNKSGTNKFKVRIRLAATSAVYGTAPTNAVSVRVRMIQQGWYEPNLTDLKGRPLSQNPPAVNTTQFWTKGTYQLGSGDNRQQIQQGLGYLLRNLIFINYPSGSVARTATEDTNFPDPFTLQFEANSLITRPRKVWQHEIARKYGLSAAVNTAEGRDYGVYPIPFTDDFGTGVGAESRRGYLSTSDAARLEIQGSFGDASSFVVLANYVSPADGDDKNIMV